MPSDTENGQSQRGRTVGADLDGIGSRNGKRRRPSASSSYSSKSVKSAGSLTLTPSRVAAATKDLLAQFQREAKEREDAKRQASLRQAEAEEEKKRAKAQARQNRPSAAIARIKSMTGRKLRRKGTCRLHHWGSGIKQLIHLTTEPSKPIPRSFYDSVHSEEETNSAIIRAQSPTTESEVSEQDTKLPGTVAKLPMVPQSKAIVRTTSFKPINRLWPDQKAPSQPTKKFGPGYSQRVRDAFSDSDESDADNGQPASVPNRLESDDGSTDSTPGTPEPFRHWFSEYETNFVPHIGFCSVADGPFKGLIRSGPQKGKYLRGHGSPSAATIDEMRKTAVPKEQLGNFWSFDSEATDVTDDERLPVHVPLSSKSTASSESDSTSILIMKQLSQEAPPSNQELGILMSSSPSRSMDHALQSPVCLPAWPSPRACKSGKSDHDQANRAHTPKGAIEHDCRDVDLEVTPNFERALSQVETPSTRSKSSQTQKTPIDISVSVSETPPRMIGRLVVKIPQLSAEKQAEYKIVPETNQELSASASFKSFKEINRVHGDIVHASQDSGSAAIEQILNASPSWLTSITEIRPQSPDTPKKAPYRLRSSTATTPCKKMPTMQPKLELDLTKDQDPTYQPSEPSSASESSADTESKRARKVVETPATPTSRKPTQALESGCDTSPVHQQETKLAPVKTLKDMDNRPQWIHSTPVPAPSISELLQRIKTATVSEQSGTNTASAGQSRSFSDSQPLRNKPMSLENDTAIVTENTAKQRNKRKHKDKNQNGNDDIAPHRKRRKSNRRSNSAETNHDETMRETDKRDGTLHTKTDNSITTTETIPVVSPETHVSYHLDLSTARSGDVLITDDKAFTTKRERRRRNRMNKRVDDKAATANSSKQANVQMPAPTQDRSPASRPAKRNPSSENEALQMSISGDLQALSKQAMVQAPSAQRSRVTKEQSSAVPSAHVDRKRKEMAHVPRPSRKLLSPPITSRPSSAGSAS